MFDIFGKKVKIWKDQTPITNLKKKQAIEFVDGKIIGEVLSNNSSLLIV